MPSGIAGGIGSFADNFIKAFIAAQNFRLRKQEMQMMTDFMHMRMDEMRLNMKKTAGEIGTQRGMQGREIAEAVESHGGGMNYDNGKKIYDYLTNKGVNPEAAKGFVGSMAEESNGFENSAWNPKDPDTPSGGWGQWHGDRLNDFASRAGNDPSKWTANDNFDMFRHEMEDTDTGAKTLRELQNASTIEEGAHISANTYEGSKPGPTQHMDTRINNGYNFNGWLKTQKPQVQAFPPYRVAEAGDQVPPPPVTDAQLTQPAPSSDYTPSSSYPQYQRPAPQNVPPNQTPMPPPRPADLGQPRPTANLVPNANQLPQGVIQYNVPGVRGQQPGQGGPLYTAAGQPQPPIPARGQPSMPPQQPGFTPTVGGAGDQAVPTVASDQVANAPMPPIRPIDTPIPTDAGGGPAPPTTVGQNNGYLWAGSSGEPITLADPSASIYGDGGMGDFAMDMGVIAARKGGPIGYARGGVVGFQYGGGTDEWGDDGGDPVGDMMRLDAFTRDSDEGGSQRQDLPTSIQQQATQPETSSPEGAMEMPPPGLPTEQGQGQPQPTDETPPPAAPGSQYPPGSYDVAGLGSSGLHAFAPGFSRPSSSMYGGRGMNMRMPSPWGGMSRSMTGVGRNRDQTLFVPPSLQGKDVDAMGIAPVNNPDGSPGVWLGSFLDNGTRALFSAFNFANRGAMPGSPQAQQAEQSFMNGEGAPSKSAMDELGDEYDPKHVLTEDERDLAASIGMFKYYCLSGQLDSASRLAGGILMYTRMQSMEYGGKAAKLLMKGDMEGGLKYLQKSYDWVPDGMKADYSMNEDGSIHVRQLDGNGKAVKEQDFGPEQVFQAAFGMQKGSGYWTLLGEYARTTGTDPVGSHLELEKMTRGLAGNQGVGLGPAADGQNKRQQQPQGPQPLAAPPNQAGQPAMPPQNPPLAMPPPNQPSPANVGALPNRPNPNMMVAGPGAPSPAGGSGAQLVAAQQDRDAQRDTINSMLAGGQYDANNSYLQTKYDQAQQQILGSLNDPNSLIAQRQRLIDAFSQGSGLSKADQQVWKDRVNGQIRAFDETQWKPAVAKLIERKQTLNSDMQRAFNVAKTQQQQQFAQQQQHNTEVFNQENEWAKGQQKDMAPRSPNDKQFLDLHGQRADGTPLDVMGTRIYGLEDSLGMPLDHKEEKPGAFGSNDTYIVNPLEGGFRLNPFVSASFNGQPDSFQTNNIPDKLINRNAQKIISDGADDMLTYSRTLNAAQAKDLAVGLGTGAYTIANIETFKGPRSPILTSKDAPDLVNEDGTLKPLDSIERVRVRISRGRDDPVTMDRNGNRTGGIEVIMSRNDAVKLAHQNRMAIDIGIEHRSHMISPSGQSPYNLPARELPPLPPRTGMQGAEAAGGASKAAIPDAPISLRPRRLQNAPLPAMPPRVPLEQMPDEWKKIYGVH
jgi:hypothetical protein